MRAPLPQTLAVFALALALFAGGFRLLDKHMRWGVALIFASCALVLVCMRLLGLLAI